MAGMVAHKTKPFALLVYFTSVLAAAYDCVLPGDVECDSAINQCINSCCNSSCKQTPIRLAYFSTGKVDAYNQPIADSSASFYLPAVYLAATAINNQAYIASAVSGSDETTWCTCEGLILPTHYLHITEVYTAYEINSDIGNTLANFDKLVNFNNNKNSIATIVSEPNFPLINSDNDEVDKATQAALTADFLMILGPNTNGEADFLPPFATGYQVVQLAHAVDSPDQSQVTLFPSFFRLSLPNTVYTNATANLIQQLNYKSIAILVEGTSDGFPEIVSTKK